ncbi:hypothetical protein CEXT_147491 [Caerostris extrusa]|uniref:Uncharacterized protein n=1 Tax=Caerostris extrusa TaxID=172846 RepID=A0AAV4M640_CAEEX|nr:hypothetical protein CEXT_147491 [Caerostris extrusa]
MFMLHRLSDSLGFLPAIRNCEAGPSPAGNCQRLYRKARLILGLSVTRDDCIVFLCSDTGSNVLRLPDTTNLISMLVIIGNLEEIQIS